MNEVKILKADDVALYHDESGSQVLALPAGFELPGEKVSLRKEGDRIVIEPSPAPLEKPKTWAEFLDTLEPVDVDWPDIDEGLPPLDDIKL